ncbi:uncharacterized protein LOC135836378 [Planococcus citri]|uniref:uncharacterized protein LOC135836378 n=1 Tax=Planococcus citri TaxID=170843 RepID=UPI0031F9876B
MYIQLKTDNVLETVIITMAISCNDILREGSVTEFSKDDLATLSSSTPQQLETCLFILGKNELDKQRAQILWETIKTVYGSVNDIPEENLKQFGWLISGIPVADFSNITVTDIDTVTMLGLYRNLSNYQVDTSDITKSTNFQLVALKQTIDNQWSRKTPEQLTSIDLTALRQILCAFNDSEILSIHPDSYRDAAGELATLQNCPKSVLSQLVTLAMDDAAFGSPSKWNSIQVASIGCVMAGLSTASRIPPESMEGITPDIIECLPSSFLQTMTSKQMQHLTTNAASSISSGQMEGLSSDQKDAIDLAITGLKYTKQSSSATLSSTST